MRASESRRNRWRKPGRTQASVIAGAALSVGLVMLMPQPAQADDGGLLVSTDGTHYGTSATDALFGGGIVMTPGATHSASLYLKNPTTTDAVFSIRLADVRSSDSRFADSLSLAAHVGATGEAGDPVSLGSDEACPAVVAEGALPAGGTVQNVLDLAMADVPGAVAQGQDTGFALRVTVRDAGTPAPASACDGGKLVPAFESASGPRDAVAGVLASTGVRAGMSVLVAGALLGAGLLAVRASRRRRGLR